MERCASDQSCQLAEQACALLNADRGSLPGEVNVQNDPRCGNTETYSARDGVPIGPQAESSWLFTYPQGASLSSQICDSLQPDGSLARDLP